MRFVNPLSAWLALVAICYGIVTLAILTTGQAVTLQISGHVSGAGMHLMNFSGDNLNVSLLQNGTSWNLTVVGT